MDILRFIKSADIRNYLKEINYQFSSLEAAWLIYQSDASIKEKHAAWNELIATMPDCEIEKRGANVPQSSLHSFLKSYMEIEDKCVREFCSDCDADGNRYVFLFKYNFADGSSYYLRDGCGTILIADTPDVPLETAFEPDEDVVTIDVEKVSVNGINYNCTETISRNLEPLKIDPWLFEDKREGEIFQQVFGWMWFDFPVPFKRGDVVCRIGWDGEYRLCDGPVVVTKTTFDHCKESPSYCGVDETDMSVWGYFVNSAGNVYAEVGDRLMEYEYYRGQLDGYRRQQLALSAFMKGEIDEAQLLNACVVIRAEEAAKVPPMGTYTEEQLRRAGVITGEWEGEI